MIKLSSGERFFQIGPVVFEFIRYIQKFKISNTYNISVDRFSTVNGI